MGDSPGCSRENIGCSMAKDHSVCSSTARSPSGSVACGPLSAVARRYRPNVARRPEREKSMHRTTSLLLPSILALLGATPAFGQAPTPPAAQVEAMKKLDPWVGEWKGSGWALAGRGQRRDFSIVE